MTTFKRLAVWIALLTGFSIPGHCAGLLVADGGFGGVLEITEHSVEVTVNNGVAVTKVDQVFRNTENRQVEALYTFPVPPGASVSNFSMWIGGTEMVGEVVEKERAREIYNSYKQQRRDPGLLEQKDYKTFEMRIFPIGPNAEQRVRIEYYQELDTDFDWTTYVYPLATVSQPNVDARITEKFAIQFRVKSEVPIVQMESPSHPNEFVFTNHDETLYEASLEMTEGTLARDVVLAYQVSRPQTGFDLLTSKRGREDGYFTLTLTPGEELESMDSGMDYVFVLDISGSMQNDLKLQTSAEAVGAFVEALGEQDRFELLAFNVQPVTLFNSLQTVTEETLGRATQFLGSQQAKGGTLLQPAMNAAYRYADTEGDRPLNVIVLSDGLTEQKDRGELIRLISQRPQNTKVFCIGVGNDVNRPLLEQMAKESGGLAALISRGDDFERQAKAFRRKLTKPVATDLVARFEGGDVYDVLPEKLPNLYHGTPIRIYGRYRNPGPLKVRIEGNLNGYEFNQEADMQAPDNDQRNPEIERMWAWHRVQDLLEVADTTGSRATVIDEIVRLGEGYSIATEYTSFLVLENESEYQRWKIARDNALKIERDRTAQARLRDELDRIREASLDGIGPLQENSKLAKASPQNPAVVSPQASKPDAPRPVVQRPSDNSAGSSFNLDLPVRSSSSRGGGAIDPVTGLAIVGFGGYTLLRRKKS
ncbi:MAG: VWA domain-containing protein [Candidatus Omnitrophica bacterium]|nr:VWA domain-containing protein [Candidatus Omnitrophota bacterium]